MLLRFLKKLINQNNILGSGHPDVKSFLYGFYMFFACYLILAFVHTVSQLKAIPVTPAVFMKGHLYFFTVYAVISIPLGIMVSAFLLTSNKPSVNRVVLGIFAGIIFVNGMNLWVRNWASVNSIHWGSKNTVGPSLLVLFTVVLTIGKLVVERWWKNCIDYLIRGTAIGISVYSLAFLLSLTHPALTGLAYFGPVPQTAPVVLLISLALYPIDPIITHHRFWSLVRQVGDLVTHALYRGWWGLLIPVVVTLQVINPEQSMAYTWSISALMSIVFGLCSYNIEEQVGSGASDPFPPTTTTFTLIVFSTFVMVFLLAPEIIIGIVNFDATQYAWILFPISCMVIGCVFEDFDSKTEEWAPRGKRNAETLLYPVVAIWISIAASYLYPYTSFALLAPIACGVGYCSYALTLEPLRVQNVDGLIVTKRLFNNDVQYYSSLTGRPLEGEGCFVAYHGGQLCYGTTATPVGYPAQKAGEAEHATASAL